jgi:hypothetical protein
MPFEVAQLDRYCSLQIRLPGVGGRRGRIKAGVGARGQPVHKVWGFGGQAPLQTSRWCWRMGPKVPGLPS